MLRNISYNLYHWLKEAGVSDLVSVYLTDGIIYVALVLISFIAYWLTKKILLRIIHRISVKSKNRWDDALIDNKFFSRLSYFVPLYIIYGFTPSVLTDYPQIATLIQRTVTILIIVVVLMAINAFLNALVDIFQDFTVAKKKPVKSYVQVVKIIVISIGLIVIVANMFGKNPMGLLGGIGAFSAVLLLIFRDPILGFAGGIQLSANDMLKIGDWIEMPKFNADGTVIDIALTTVKVQNWDMTISNIPTYALIESSFKNWKGMEESGGRRIKRSFNIDMTSIGFVTEELTGSLDREGLFRPEWMIAGTDTVGLSPEKEHLVSFGSQTNAALFRRYLKEYLSSHPLINHDMTLLIHYLNPGENGLPLEIYTFCADKTLENYTEIQAGIVEHVLTVMPLFGLRIFQREPGKPAI